MKPLNMSFGAFWTEFRGDSENQGPGGRGGFWVQLFSDKHAIKVPAAGAASGGNFSQTNSQLVRLFDGPGSPADPEKLRKHEESPQT